MSTLKTTEQRSASSPTEPLSDVAYRYDGSVEGLFTAVFQAYANREHPRDVVCGDTLQPRLGQTVHYIETEVDLALRVQKGIRHTCGQAALEAIMHAALADAPDAGTIVYHFIRHAMTQNRSVMNDLAHPAVGPLLKLDRCVMNERHRMLQFLRFEHLENGAWFAQCNPHAAVIPLIMDWFSGRFNTQPFMIFDENHAMAGVYEGRDWYLVRTNEITLPDQAADEKIMQSAWKRFYDTVAIEARYNPELRRQFMPKRFWKHILEMHERIDATNIARQHTPAQAVSLSAEIPSHTPVRSKGGIKLSSAVPPSCQK